jgi:hypothetical protein
VSDKASGTNSTASGWNFATSDTQKTFLPFLSANLKPRIDGAAGVIITRPENYPDTDFYGTSIPTENAAAGAVQTVAALGYYLTFEEASSGGTVSLSSGSTNADGLFTAAATLTATPTTDYLFSHWIVNSVEQAEQTPANQISVPMTVDTTVTAVFGISIGISVSFEEIKDVNITLEEFSVYKTDHGDSATYPASKTITLEDADQYTAINWFIEGEGIPLGFNQSAIPLPSGNMYYNNTITSGGSQVYQFYANSGTRYTIDWNDSFQGDGTKTADIKVSAAFGSTQIFSNEDSGYPYGPSFTLSKSGYVTLTVTPYYDDGQGTYAIACVGVPGNPPIDYIVIGTDDSITINAASLTATRHYLTVELTKDGKLYSKTISFLVEI